MLVRTWEDRGEMSVGELWRYFTSHTDLPRLVRREVLDRAVERSLSEVLIEGEQFALASGKDGERYQGLVVEHDAGARVTVTDNTLLVNVDRARAQQQEERPSGEQPPDPPAPTVRTELRPQVAEQRSDSPERRSPSRFFGSVTVDPERYARDLRTIMAEVLDRLAATESDMEITLDIHATKPGGFDEADIRTIRENTATLRFNPSSGFEDV